MQKVIHGDSREVCKTLPDLYFSSIVTDPPYGEGFTIGDESPELSAKLLQDVLSASMHSLKPASHVAVFWSTRTVDLAIDAVRNSGLLFRRLLYMYVPKGNARPFRGWLPRVQPIILARSPGRDAPQWRVDSATAIDSRLKELRWSRAKLAKQIGVSRRLVMKWAELDDDAWSYPNQEHRSKLKEILGVEIPPPPTEEKPKPRHDLYRVTGGGPKTTHPCEKPLSVVADIVNRLGGPVLDPFCGSGTTLVAAKTLGIAAVGIEADSRYADVSSGRLRQGMLLV